MDGADPIPGTAYPPATPAAMADLVQLLAERGVALRVSPGGELLIRDRDKRLSPADRAAVHHYRHDLADWLAAPGAAAPECGAFQHPKRDESDETARPKSEGSPAGPRCDRCGGVEFVEVPTHGGASVRRDCGRCGRTWGFPVWRGE
ncbi:hypothetical protein [Botrimarina mediterranea]|uniref:hypothetical protein n=1 Tax=Botrimarina mediterranea TaxID=2528022 RepID=UPI001188EA11|nr:hypothetical protein K2D_06420 [Planctomycetes bacterium K2D]